MPTTPLAPPNPHAMRCTPLWEIILEIENSLMAGGEYLFHFSEHLGLGPTFFYTKADYTENRYYNQAGFFTNDNLYGFDLTGQYTFPTSINFGEHQLDLDLFILLGAGTVQINDAYEPHGVIGGGFKIYTNKPWLALRMDMRGTMHTTNKPGGANEFDQDLLLCLGVSFQIPPQL